MIPKMHTAYCGGAKLTTNDAASIICCKFWDTRWPDLAKASQYRRYAWSFWYRNRWLCSRLHHVRTSENWRQESSWGQGRRHMTSSPWAQDSRLPFCWETDWPLAESGMLLRSTSHANCSMTWRHQHACLLRTLCWRGLHVDIEICLCIRIDQSLQTTKVLGNSMNWQPCALLNNKEQGAAHLQSEQKNLAFTTILSEVVVQCCGCSIHCYADVRWREDMPLCRWQKHIVHTEQWAAEELQRSRSQCWSFACITLKHHIEAPHWSTTLEHHTEALHWVHDDWMHSADCKMSCMQVGSKINPIAMNNLRSDITHKPTSL